MPPQKPSPSPIRKPASPIRKPLSRLTAAELESSRRNAHRLINAARQSDAALQAELDRLYRKSFGPADAPSENHEPEVKNRQKGIIAADERR